MEIYDLIVDLKIIFNQENEPIRFSKKLSVVFAFKPGIGFSNQD